MRNGFRSNRPRIAASIWLTVIDNAVARVSVMNAMRVPEVVMSNRNGFVPDSRPEPELTR